jgi:hypothetical protein
MWGNNPPGIDQVTRLMSLRSTQGPHGPSSMLFYGECVSSSSVTDCLSTAEAAVANRTDRLSELCTRARRGHTVTAGRGRKRLDSR